MWKSWMQPLLSIAHFKKNRYKVSKTYFVLIQGFQNLFCFCPTYLESGKPKQATLEGTPSRKNPLLGQKPIFDEKT